MQGAVGDIANRILAINPMILPLLVNGCFIGTLHQLFTALYTYHHMVFRADVHDS